MRFAAALLLLPTLAHAQAKLVPSDANKGAEDKDIEGWNTFLGLTATLNVTSNSNVIGQVDGTSMLFGLGLLGGADYVRDKHVFRSNLAINEGFTRTPVVDRFVKTADTVKLEGLYNYFLVKNAGIYGRLSLQTAFLPGYDVRGMPTTWVDVTDSTMPVTLATAAIEQRLSRAFLPLTLTESAGGFYDPIKKEAIEAALRLGMGARETWADGVLVVHDEMATPEVEVVHLSDVFQFGIEAFAGASGKLDKGKANYKAGIAALLPLVNNDKYNRSALALTRVAFEANFTYTPASWLSFVYTAAITRDPQLFPEGKEVVQIQNMLLVTLQLALVKKTEKPKGKTKEEQELEDAKKRADEAEQRAKDAEAAAKAAADEVQKLQQQQQEQQQQPPPAPAPAP